MLTSAPPCISYYKQNKLNRLVHDDSRQLECPSLQGSINLQNPRLPPSYEWFGHNAYFLGPQNFCPQQQNKKNWDHFSSCLREAPFLKMAHVYGYCLFGVGSINARPNIWAISWLLSFWGVGEGRVRTLARMFCDLMQTFCSHFFCLGIHQK